MHDYSIYDATRKDNSKKRRLITHTGAQKQQLRDKRKLRAQRGGEMVRSPAYLPRYLPSHKSTSSDAYKHNGGLRGRKND